MHLAATVPASAETPAISHRYRRQQMTELNLFNHPMRRVLADPVFGWPLFPGESAGGDSGESTEFTYRPAADIRDAGSEFVIDLDLPGVPKDSAKVEFHNGHLTVEAQRSAKPEVLNGENGEARWTRRERVAGPYRRSFRIPETVDVSRIQAGFEDGVLTLVLPKLEKAQPRQIEVKVN